VVNEAKEARFCELLEQGTLDEWEWFELEDLARDLDCDEAFHACLAELAEELDAGRVRVQ